MRKSIFLIMLTILLFTGCISNNNGNGSGVETVTSYDETITTIQSNGNSTESSTEEVETNYIYDEGIFYDKEWYLPSLDDENGQEVSNINTAIAIAKTEFKRIQESGIGTSYVFKGVFFDTDDEIWVVWFAKPEIMIGACYNIAISKATGKVLHTWPGE